ncbi:unnamed protein product, partial [Rotaria magnacalcarata]
VRGGTSVRITSVTRAYYCICLSVMRATGLWITSTIVESATIWEHRNGEEMLKVLPDIIIPLHTTFAAVPVFV